MTNREFYTNILNGTLTEVEIEFAKSAIAKLDERNAKRSSKPSKTAIANEPIKAAILEVLTDEPQAASAIGVAVEQTTQKASALLRQLVADGKAVAVDMKVKGKGKVKGYTLADADTDTEDEVDE